MQVLLPLLIIGGGIGLVVLLSARPAPPVLPTGKPPLLPVLDESFILDVPERVAISTEFDVIRSLGDMLRERGFRVNLERVVTGATVFEPFEFGDFELIGEAAEGIEIDPIVEELVLAMGRIIESPETRRIILLL